MEKTKNLVIPSVHFIARNRIDPVREKNIRRRLINYTEKVVFKEMIDGTYWENVFKIHQDPEHGFTTVDPFFDLFKPASVDPNKKEEKENLTTKEVYNFMCIVPCLRPYWDLILSLYHLYAPDIFRDVPHVAQCLYTKLEEAWKYNKSPTDFENYDENIHRYLRSLFTSETLEGGKYNWYLTNPGETFFLCQRAFLMLQQGFKGDESDELIREVEDIHLKQAVEKFKEENKGDLPAVVNRFSDQLSNLKDQTLKIAKSHLSKKKKGVVYTDK